jgi:hypothetical protein
MNTLYDPFKCNSWSTVSFSPPNRWAENLDVRKLPKIIGISGKKLHGKDTLADILTRLLLPKTSAKLPFALPLKRELANACGVDIAFIEKNKAAFRTALQWWGGNFRRDMCGKDYWVERFKVALVMDFMNFDYILVPDVRFLNEVEAIKGLGGKVLRVERTGFASDNDSHPSETQLDGYEFETTLYARDKSELESVAKQLLPLI